MESPHDWSIADSSDEHDSDYIVYMQYETLRCFKMTQHLFWIIRMEEYKNFEVHKHTIAIIFCGRLSIIFLEFMMDQSTMDGFLTSLL